MKPKSSCYKIQKGILNIPKLNNKKLVNILNSKIFKGYNEIKNSKSFFHQIPKSVKIVDYENENLESFDDNYNLLYKKKYLSKLNNNCKIKNPFLIKNFSFSQQNHKMNKTIDLNSNNNNLSKIKNQKKSIHYNNRILLEKKRIIFNQLFPDLNETKHYSNIPFLFIERHIQKPISSKDKLIMSSDKYYNKYDGLTENQFLYKISHKNFEDLNSFKLNNQIKKVYSSRQVKYNSNRDNFLNNLSSKDLTDTRKSKGKNKTKENGTQITINKSFNGNKRIGIRNVFYKNLVFNYSFKKNDSTYNSEINDNIPVGTSSKRKLNINNPKKLVLNNYNKIFNNIKIFTNQKSIDERYFKKHKFNILKQLMKGKIE